VFKLPPDAQVAPGISVSVSLKVFVVELKYNCPSICFVNVEGAVHSSVCAFGETEPPKAKALAGPVPAPAKEDLAVLKSLISVQEVPFQFSVTAVAGGVSPPKS